MKRWSLVSRGYLLISAPVLWQIVFAIVLSNFLITVENEMARESHSKNLMIKLSAATRETTSIVYNIHTTTELGEGSLDAKGADLKIKGQKLWSEVLNFAKNDMQLQKQLAEIQSIINAAFESADHWRLEKSKPDANREKLRAAEDSLTSSCLRLPEVIGQIEQIEEALTKEHPFQSKETEEKIRVFFGVAMLVSILSSLGLGLLFAKSIRNPLRHTVANARLLSRREPLLSPLTADSNWNLMAPPAELIELDLLIAKVSREVARALERERDMLENVAELICSLNEEGTFTEVNPYAKNMLGLTPEAMLGRSLLEFVFADDCVRASEQLNAARLSSVSTEFELRMQGSEGQLISTRWFATWSEAQHSLFCVVHDLTEAKKLETLKQDFVDMVSHDLRSPLMSMHGSLTMIAEGAKGPISLEAETEAKEAARSIELLTSMISDLLDFQKLQAGKMQIDPSEFELRDLLVESIDMVQPIAQQKGTPLVVAKGQWPIYADRNKLRQTIINLISNAIKFSPENEPVEIEVKEADAYMEIRIIDRGPGIPEEHREKIFEAFEQLPSSDRKGEGSGLGLAICKMIVLAHDGEIGVRSRDSNTSGAPRFDGSAIEEAASSPMGSVFWLRIPDRTNSG